MNSVAELRGLTGARGIAAWVVMLYHIRLSIAGLPAPIVAILAKGYLAVDFFFLLSGFVIWLAWGERLRRDPRGQIVTFLQRRVARIWPLHLAMLAAALAYALVMRTTGRDVSADFPLAELPLHIMLVQNWGWTDTLTWNDPAWSISAELAAYLLFPLLAMAVDWRRMPSIALVAIAATLLLALHLVMARAGAMKLGDEIQRFGVLRCLVEFACGGIICALWLRWRSCARTAPLAYAVAALGAAGTIVGILPETLAIPATFAALLLALASTNDERSPLARQLPHYLGEISYATYLSHFLLFVAFKLILVDDPRAVSPLLIALYLAIVLGASILLYHLLERPAQRWINALPLGRAPAAAGARAG